VAVEDFSTQTEQIDTARQALMKEGPAVALKIRNLLTRAHTSRPAATAAEGAPWANAWPGGRQHV